MSIFPVVDLAEQLIYEQEEDKPVGSIEPLDLEHSFTKNELFSTQWFEHQISKEPFEVCFEVQEPEEDVNLSQLIFQHPVQPRQNKMLLKRKGLKFIIHKLLKIYQESPIFPDYDDILKLIFHDMVSHKGKINYKSSQFANLKRRVYDCKNVIIELLNLHEGRTETDEKPLSLEKKYQVKYLQLKEIIKQKCQKEPLDQ